MKVYTIFAGVNGAGKSTFYKALNRDYGVRINLDEIIKVQFNHDWNNPKVQMESARIAVKLLRDCLNGDTSFNQETTLAGRTVISNIKLAKANGFKVHLFYVGLRSVELSIERVAVRERLGGHGIPTEDLRRRYANSFENLKVVLPLCNSVQIYDNSGSSVFDALNPLLVVKDDKIGLLDENCPQYLSNVLSDFISGLKN